MSEGVVATPSHVLLVEEGPNPSSDYFVLPWLQGERAFVRRCGLDEVPELAAIDGVRVVFVRYISSAWRNFIEHNHRRLAGIDFFMDDDLFDGEAAKGMPARYRWKLFRLARRHREWLWGMGARLVVSTPWLAQKYARWEPVQLAAHRPFPECEPPLQTVFYHGSASHRQEMEWLVPVMEAVLEAEEGLAFEVIGDRRVRRLFGGLPRTHVLHPLSWPDYQALLRQPGRSIGLAPLLESPFNAARAPTKFFDITRAGAVGVFAEGGIYETLVDHDENGILAPMEPEAWVAAIRELATDPIRRQRLLEGARACL